MTESDPLVSGDPEPCETIDRRDVRGIFGRPTSPGERELQECSWGVGDQFAVGYTPLENIPAGGGDEVLAGRRRQARGRTRDVPALGDDAYYEADPELCAATLNVRDGDFVFLVHVSATLPIEGNEPCLPVKNREKLVALARLILERQQGDY